MQKWIQPPACSDHGLHRILSSFWLAHFHLMKKSPKVQLYFGLDCGTMEFFTYEPQSKEQLISLPYFWSTVRRKRLRFEHMHTVIRTSRRIIGLFARSGSELWSCFKYSELKLKKSKTYSGWCYFQGISNDTTLMQIQSTWTVPLTLIRMTKDEKVLAVFKDLLL